MGDPLLTGFDITVVVNGYASMRWRGAKNTAERVAFNQALSEQRARNVSVVVKRILKRELPSWPAKVTVNAYGALRSPQIQGPKDNEPFTRIVHVTVYMMTSRLRKNVVPQKPLIIPARTKIWTMRVLYFQPLALGVAGGRVKLALRNGISHKETTFTGTVYGGGLGAKPSDWFGTDPPQVGDEVFFMTNKDMGFADFGGQMVRMGTVEAKLIIGASYSYLTFISLGSEAQNLAFDSGFGIGFPAMKGAVMSGRIYMSGRNPGDDWVVPRPPNVVAIRDRKDFEDGMILTFPTGKSSYSDLSADDRRKLEDLITTKARASKDVLSGVL